MRNLNIRFCEENLWTVKMLGHGTYIKNYFKISYTKFSTICLFIFYINSTEKRVWFLTLITGTLMLYSTRTSMPLLIPAVAAEQKWSKTDSGTVLSSFFWGYTLTQVFAHANTRI